MTKTIKKIPFSSGDNYAIKKIRFAKIRDNDILYHGDFYYARKVTPDMEFGKNNIIDDMLDSKIYNAIYERFNKLEVETFTPMTLEELKVSKENFRKYCGQVINLYLVSENNHCIEIGLGIITSPPDATRENFSSKISIDELSECQKLFSASFKRYDEEIGLSSEES